MLRLRLIAAALFSLGSAAAAQEATVMAPPAESEPVYRPGDIVLAYEGGIVGKGVGRTLEAILEAKQKFPTKRHVIVEGDDPCRLLLTAGVPPPCEKHLLKTLDLLNSEPKPSKGKLSVGSTIILPDLQFRRYRTGRIFEVEKDGDIKGAKKIVQSWTDLNARQEHRKQGLFIEYDAYELRLPTTDEKQQVLVQKILIKSDIPSRNILLEPIPHEAQAVTLHAALTGPDYQKYCKPDNPWPTVDYREYAESDADLGAIVSNLPIKVTPRVYVLDVAMAPTPNLRKARGLTAADAPDVKTCAWRDWTFADHSTHLAGIVASDAAGFRGLAPEASIPNFSWSHATAGGAQIPPTRRIELGNLIRKNATLDVPAIYLVASLFQAPGPAPIEPATRFHNPVEGRIQGFRPFFVVSAGHVGENESPREIGPTTAATPSNLGDQPNVVVVTACTDCRRGRAVLHQRANFGRDGRFVHLAAPGGAELPGWLDADEVGAMGGTSQATAYVAGVAASMVARYPDYYDRSELTKLRLLTTSWPIYRGPGKLDGDNLKLTTGTVDPLMALLPPNRTWLKDDKGWRQVRLVAVKQGLSKIFSTDGSQSQLGLENVFRIVRVSEPSQPNLWILYHDRYGANVAGSYPQEIERIGPTSEIEGEIEVCAVDKPDRETLKLSSLLDLVLPLQGWETEPCS